MGENGLPKLEARVRVHHDASGKAELLGFADLVIAGCFVIKGVRLLKSKRADDEPASFFVSFPSRKGTGENAERYFELAHPVTASARSAAREAVLAAYQQALRG